MLSGLKRFIVGKVSDNELAESFDDMYVNNSAALSVSFVFHSTIKHAPSPQ